MVSFLLNVIILKNTIAWISVCWQAKKIYESLICARGQASSCITGREPSNCIFSHLWDEPLVVVRVHEPLVAIWHKLILNHFHAIHVAISLTFLPKIMQIIIYNTVVISIRAIHFTARSSKAEAIRKSQHGETSWEIFCCLYWCGWGKCM